MDSNERRQRQINPSGYGAQQRIIQASSQYAGGSSSERFRHQQQIPVQSPTSVPSGRGDAIQGYGYSYGEGAQFSGSQVQGGSLQYQTGYGQNSQRQQSSYQQYGTNLSGMYNVASEQSAPQSPYESVPPYQGRQSAAIEVLSTQFGVPHQYYGSGDAGPTSAPSTVMAAQNVQSQYTPISYSSQSPVGREALTSAYGSGMSDQGQTTSRSGAYGAATYGSQTAAQAADLDIAYGQYLQELRRTFAHVRDRRLAEAGASLLRISDWLLSNAEALVRDDEAMHMERLKLWEQFNTCWLTTLQRQKEMTEEMLNTGQRPHPPQSLLEQEYMEMMGKELIRLCDAIEKHGLVDYQMGVWEEEIMTLLTRCLDLLDDKADASRSSEPPASSTAAPPPHR